MISGSQLATDIGNASQNPEALHRLLSYYSPYLQLIAEESIGARLRRREGASDVVQRTLMEAVAAIKQCRGESEPEFTVWIHQILRRNPANLVRDNFAAKRDVRREQCFDPSDESATITWFLPAADQTTPDVKVTKAEAALNLACAIESLPEDQRLAIRMRHLEKAGIAAIAEAMDRTPAAVASLLRRGLQGLREQLKE